MDLKELTKLLEKQGEAFGEFKASNDERYSRLEADFLDLAKKAGRPPAPGWGGVGPERMSAFVNFCRTGDTSFLAAETKAAIAGSDPAGGYLVPEQIDSQIGSIRMKNSPMRQICRVLRPQTPEYKRIVTTGRPSSGWVGETMARPETGPPSISVLKPAWGGLYANPAASQDLIEDSAFDVADWFKGEVAKEFSDQEGEAFITGNGILKPRGLLTFNMVTTGDATRTFGEIQYIAGGHATLLNNTDKIIDMVYSLKSKYRQSAVWLMNSLTLATIRKFKDGDGSYIWRPGLEAGQPSLLLGYPVYESDFMPDIGADAYPVALADFMEAFWIFDRPTTVLRDMFTNKPYTHFYTATRVGSMLANSEAVKVLKIAAA